MFASFACTYVILTYRYGSLNGTNRGTIFLNTSVSAYKESIDTGKFVPGVYRVNPYEVQDGTILAVMQGPVEIIGVTYDGEYRWEATWTGNILASSVHSGLNSQLPSTDSLAQQALQKAHAKLGESALSLGEDLGELRETLEMLRNPFGSLRKFLLDDRQRNLRLLKALANKDRRQVNRLLGRTGLASADAMTSTWLEIRYGLRPLVYLTQDVIEQVSDKAKKVWDPEKIRSARSNIEGKNVNSFSSRTDLGKMYLYSHVSVVDEVTVYAAVQYRQSTPDTLLDQLGLTPKFLPETAWELTRLSFVLDWFVSIGPWLGSLRVSPNIEILGSTLGTKLERYVSVDAVEAQYKYSPDDGSKHLTVSGNSSASRRFYSRTVNPDTSFIPHLTYGRTWDYLKSLDSIALLWSVIH